MEERIFLSFIPGQETLTDIELWDVQWKPAKIGVYKEKSIRYPSGGTKAAAAAAQPAVQAYRPPMAQGRACAFKLHDDEDLAPAGDKIRLFPC